MTTAIHNDFQIVEIIKERAKTSIVRDLTSYSDETFIVKNANLTEDKFIELDEETAKNATIIVRKSQPKYGMQRFNYNSQDLGDGEFMHTFGQGSNSGIITNMKEWRVIR